MDKAKVLKRYFGHAEFRPGQEALIDALLAGRDALGVMPTGAGKSICYQLPALMLPGLTVVISPLISLMKDQVAALSQSGIPSAYINSSLSPEQYREVYRLAGGGAYKILYVAPERLSTADFLRFAGEAEISLLAVDEAHCVSQWGQDFRPSYLKIAEFAASLPRRPVVGAFTATATAAVKADIEELLQLQNPLAVSTGFDRPNLYFEVLQPQSKDAWLRAFLAGRPGQSGIVYCATRKAVESVCDRLRKGGVSATRYHAGLEDAERRQNQEDFVHDRSRVMVATNAFGMGIDKSNVGFVVHYNMPKDIESYYQEAGRAGRDGERAFCALLFSAGDVRTAKFLINNAEENEGLSGEERELVRKRDLERLNRMIAYCRATGCLRACLLHYFGESAATDCGNCGNCAGEAVREDITVEAQKILSCVARVEKKYACGLGLTLIVRTLHGSKERRVMQLGLDKLPTYGILRDADRPRIREYIDCLVREGYLTLTGDEYPVLRTTGRTKQVLFCGEKVAYIRRKQAPRKEPAPSRKAPAAAPKQAADEGLLAALKALRTRLAQTENVPVYIVFSNATLADMAARQPRSPAEFLRVTGVGEVKAARYGQVFLEEIRRWMGEADRG
ncbi:MAG: DNA helicase RecQ [Clostridiales bacterium]|nr:DNA helicase RecQ [Clostridiales bacterium]